MWQKLNDRCKKFFQALAKGISAYWATILAVFAVALLVALGVGLVLHLKFGMHWADWVGLGDYTGPLTQDQRGKTLWDWLELLIVPIVLAIGAFLFNKSEKENEQKIATDRQREAALQSYIDKMTELLLDKDTPLRKSQGEDEVRAVARTRTLATLRMLDSDRKGMLVQFLFEAELMTKTGPIIDLHGADLSGANLSGASLHGVDLSGANLSGANLHSVDLGAARLHRANLHAADLNGANLIDADLNESDLRKAHLQGASLWRTNLSCDDLRGADLSRADLTDANLSQVSLSGADLSRADLSRGKLGLARMSGTNSFMANLCDTDLFRADLSGADLRGADLSRANLGKANLSKANLGQAKLGKADLSMADLRGADLRGADLRWANLALADLCGARVTKDQLAYAKTIIEATMPGGEKYDPAVHKLPKVEWGEKGPADGP